MPTFSLPWMIGPIPIIVTAWSAYVTAATLAYRRKMTGERFVAAFLLPLGIVSAASLLASTLDTRIVVSAGHISTTLSFVLTYIAEKTRCGDPPLTQTKEAGRQNIFWSLYFLSVIYILYLVFIFAFSISSACTIAKCYVLEMLFGGKIYGFSTFYFANFVGSIILSLIILLTSQLILKIKMQD